MSSEDLRGLNGLCMLELFRMEVESQSAILVQGLSALENNAGGMEPLEQLMRAAHSLNGAARIVGRSSAVRVARAMENYFAAAHENVLRLEKGPTAILLRGIELLASISSVPDDSITRWEKEHETEIEAFSASLSVSGETGRGIELHSSHNSSPDDDQASSSDENPT